MPERRPASYRTSGQSDYARALYIGSGSMPADVQTRPKIGIVSSSDESNPGHVHLGRLAQVVKEAVYEAGAEGYITSIPAGCDGVAQGEGMHWSLLSRDLGAGAVEAKVQMHQFDAMVCICSCDKIIPAMLMACARIDIPTIFVTGGLMGTYRTDRIPGRRALGTSDIKEAHGMHLAGKLSDADYEEIVECTCATSGVCNMMGTAVTMALVTEVLGLSLPGNGTVAAMQPGSRDELSDELVDIGRRAGVCIAKRCADYWLGEDATALPSSIMTHGAFENAIRAVLTVGGSTNAALHIPAVAQQLDVVLRAPVEGRLMEVHAPCLVVGAAFDPFAGQRGCAAEILAQRHRLATAFGLEDACRKVEVVFHSLDGGFVEIVQIRKLFILFHCWSFFATESSEVQRRKSICPMAHRILFESGSIYGAWSTVG